VFLGISNTQQTDGGWGCTSENIEVGLHETQIDKHSNAAVEGRGVGRGEKGWEGRGRGGVGKSEGRGKG